jgi:hypothetical protein
MNNEFPQTLVAAIRHFSDPQVAFDFMVQLRWPDGVKCPRCQSEDVSFITTRKIWKCKCCKEKSQFSVRVGTIFEDSALPLDKWLSAIWMIANDKNGVSSYEVHRAIGVTQKTAWFMLQRIRLAMQTGTNESHMNKPSKHLKAKINQSASKSVGENAECFHAKDTKRCLLVQCRHFHPYRRSVKKHTFQTVVLQDVSCMCGKKSCCLLKVVKKI